MCDKTTFPKMTAGDGFEFLSACYGEKPKMVSAIDYICHNTDFYVGVLNKSKTFPRPNHVALGKKAMKEIKDVAKRCPLSPIFVFLFFCFFGKIFLWTRLSLILNVSCFFRLYRVLAHAYYHHKDAFKAFEVDTHTRVHAHAHTHTQTHTHTHTHTHTSHIHTSHSQNAHGRACTDRQTRAHTYIDIYICM